MKIRTSHDYPPIPVRTHDWSAVTDEYDGAEDAGPQCIGYGATEREAIEDLVEQLADEAYERGYKDAERIAAKTGPSDDSGFVGGLHAARLLCLDEMVDGDVSAEDAAYNMAIRHCCDAIDKELDERAKAHARCTTDGPGASASGARVGETVDSGSPKAGSIPATSSLCYCGLGPITGCPSCDGQPGISNFEAKNG